MVLIILQLLNLLIQHVPEVLQVDLFVACVATGLGITLTFIKIKNYLNKNIYLFLAIDDLQALQQLMLHLDDPDIVVQIEPSYLVVF